jgi:hypothetical protein
VFAVLSILGWQAWQRLAQASGRRP